MFVKIVCIFVKLFVKSKMELKRMREREEIGIEGS